MINRTCILWKENKTPIPHFEGTKDQHYTRSHLLGTVTNSPNLHFIRCMPVITKRRKHNCSWYVVLNSILLLKVTTNIPLSWVALCLSEKAECSSHISTARSGKTPWCLKSLITLWPVQISDVYLDKWNNIFYSDTPKRKKMNREMLNHSAFKMNLLQEPSFHKK